MVGLTLPHVPRAGEFASYAAPRMAFIDYAEKRITSKVIYWGPPSSGKFTNLAYLYEKTGPADRPPALKQTAIGLPLTLGDIRGFRTSFMIYRNPSDGSLLRWVFDESDGRPVDGIIFVVDSSPHATAYNIASRNGLVETLAARGFDAAKLPMVVQYNKRDSSDALPVPRLRADTNPWNHPEVEAIATQGVGVFDALKAVAKLVLTEIRKAPG
jgi:mutual gliding-motility protein MglA